MKRMFVETRYVDDVVLPSDFIEGLPDKVGLFVTVQFIGHIEKLAEQIRSTGREVMLFDCEHTVYEGQILGCNIVEFEGVDAYCYVGDGLFHPKALAFRNPFPVHIFNPISGKKSVLSVDDISVIKKRVKGAYLKFMTSKAIGVLVSIKPGQNHYKKAMELENMYPDKEFYYLAFDTIDFLQLENFPFIECYVNTACPRIGLDDQMAFSKPVINLDQVFEPSF